MSSLGERVDQELARVAAQAEAARAKADPLSLLRALSERASMAQVTDALRVGTAALEGKDALEVASFREGAIQELKRIGVQSPAGMVDAALSLKKENEKPENLQGTSIIFQEPEPWPDPVDGAKLMDELAGFINRFVVLGEHELIASVLWIAHTWFVEALDFSPILGITSPEKRCGKSTLLRVLAELVRKPFRSASCSVAAIFRLVESERPTLLLDEVDSFMDGNEELRGLLNEGIESNGTFTRTVGENFEPRAFRVFCPKALSLIGKLPGTVEDRAIPIMMKRKSKGEKVERFQKRKVSPLAQELCGKLARFAKDNEQILRDSDPDVPEALNDRQADCWRPSLAIAYLTGGEWANRAREAALTLSGESEREENSSIGVQLLSDIRSLFEAKSLERISVQELLEHLAGLEERPWGEWKHGKPITSNGLARLLQPYGIHSIDFRFGEKILKGFEASMFQDTLSRYISPSQAATPQQTNTGAAESGFSNPQQTSDVADAKSEENPHEQRRVADENPESGETEDDLSHENFSEIGEDPNWHLQPVPLEAENEEDENVEIPF